MRRWAFHLLAAISLLLCLAAAGGWMHSYFALDSVVRVRTFDKRLGQDLMSISSFDGGVVYDRRVFDHGFASSGRKGATQWRFEPNSVAGLAGGKEWFGPTEGGPSLLGFGYFAQRENPSA